MTREDDALVESFVVATKRILPAGTAALPPPAELVFAYPVPKDHDATEFCENVTMFMFPHGYATSWDQRTTIPPPPVHHLFTLTDAHGDHLYGASLSFFETPSARVKSLCVLTRRPFYTQMLRYLEQLLLLGVCQVRLEASSSHAPSFVEKALCNLLHEVPVPHRGSLAVQVQLGDLELTLERPPFTEFAFETDPELLLYTLMTVDAKTLVQLYHHVLLEHRVLIVGTDNVLVLAIVETLKSLIFPFTWLHVVIPNIPDSLDLSTLLEAPVPFLAGAHAVQLAQVTTPSNVVKYDATDGRLVVPGAVESTAMGMTMHMLQNSNQNLMSQTTDSVVLPPLPEASTRLLHTLLNVRASESNGTLALKKELQHKLWERRIHLQKACLSPMGDDKSPALSLIQPKTCLLVKPKLVYRKMSKLFLDLTASYLGDYAQCLGQKQQDMMSSSSQFDAEMFLERKPSHSRSFYQALTQTSHFQSFIAQHHEYIRRELPLEDAMKFHFVLKTMLSPDTNQSKDMSTTTTSNAQSKTFVAHAPQIDLAIVFAQATAVTSTATFDVVFPLIDTHAFGVPRKIVFPSMASDAVHSSLGTFLPPTTASSRRASKDGSEWMQTFLRTMPLPSSVKPRVDTLSSSSSSSSPRLNIYGSPRASRVGVFPSAPFKRSRTIDRLKNATPFYRSMTQKSSLVAASTAQAPSTPPLTPTASTKSGTRAATVVQSIWLLTTKACACHATIVRLTQQLTSAVDSDGKYADASIEAYGGLIRALAACGHASEAKAVFEECLSGSSLLSLEQIATIPHFWKPFSELLRCYVLNGLVQRAFDLLIQVKLEDEQLLDPSMGTLLFTGQVLDAQAEHIVERVSVTFGCGNLGLCLAPRGSAPSGTGAELITFQEEDDGQMSDDVRSVVELSGLQPHDVVETINGESVLHSAFPDIITGLKQASRPMVVTFLRGLDRLEAAGDATGDEATRRISSSSASSTSAVHETLVTTISRSTNSLFKTISASTLSSASLAAAPKAMTSKGTPRRDLCDRFGLLPKRGIRITTLADCEACGTRLSLSDVQRGWSKDPNDYTTRCGVCGNHFVPRLCVMLGVTTALYQTMEPQDQLTKTDDAMEKAKVEQLEYLSMPVIRKELMNLAHKVPLTLLTMKDLREVNPRIYWNIVIKLLSLAVPLDFLDLPDMTKRKSAKLKPPPGSTTLVSPEVKTPVVDEDDEMQSLVATIVERVKRDQQENDGNMTESELLKRVLETLTMQTEVTLGVAPPSITKSSSKESLRQQNEEDEERQESDDERETDVEDMRSSRTVSVTDSSAYYDDQQQQQSVKDADTSKTKRNSKFLSHLSAAPFRRISRTAPMSSSSAS
ncbi:hypothetical protein Poli38472_003957 [Pythium oligandrum]|uniref:UDENN domain-containing protein n=1 Tax=Pythium oligandrum TaxID=41045 RepID=A0A8K1CPE7_PYTOL|nr:hypothetical protein Poli38472_003957 [Pythium oligandrum]|eukprot:TMW66192.1 hypothetical protein Poli38472_003957 [Pythium oligandrum]